MNFVELSKSSVDYGRKLVDSALAGARNGEEEFFKEKPQARYFTESVQQALAPAVIGACIGLLGGYLGNERRSPARAVACGFLGGAIGFCAGVAWESRKLTARVASSSWKSISKTRDTHWFEKNPIDYA
jgi:hypothetical protein